MKLFFERVLLVSVLGAGIVVGAGLLGVGAAQMDSVQDPLLISPLSAAQGGETKAAQADEHEGQPSHCSNAKTAPAAHKCDCQKTVEGCDVEDRKCRVYCRTNHCHCFHPACDS